MKIEIEPTDETLILDGVPVRKWEGRTEDGSACEVYVRYVVVPPEHAEAFRDLTPTRPPQSVIILSQRSAPQHIPIVGGGDGQ